MAWWPRNGPPAAGEDAQRSFGATVSNSARLVLTVGSTVVLLGGLAVVGGVAALLGGWRERDPD